MYKNAQARQRRCANYLTIVGFKHIIYDDIVAGRLIPILSDWQLPRLTINLAYQSRRHQPAKIRVFTEFLIERFAKLELEAKWAGELGSIKTVLRHRFVT